MVERIGISYANCYLLSGEGGSILIDTCNYKDGPKILERIKDKNVKLILLTHGHFDHVSSAKYLAKRLNVPIAMSEKDVPIIGRGEESALLGPAPIGRVVSFFSKFVLKKSTYSVFEPNVLLEDGQELSEYGVKAHVVELPGHTKGSVGVLTDDRDIIVGDAMFNIFRPTGSRIFEDEETMRQSVQKIKKSGATTIYVGHGKPIKNV
ncbi:MAG: MBL fold metallo-hydrolase [Firmicutes bacterium HGW-Firmicutes-16]|nr:MAG: MBL fold metallo-hydrolase [Firmicutes bacterium HGW-Firmicutes-16]